MAGAETLTGRVGRGYKHELEDQLHHLVCASQMPLATARRAIRTDWIAAYQRYVGVRP